MNTCKSLRLGHEIHLENLFFLYKDNCIWIATRSWLLEMVLHTNLVEIWNVFDLDWRLDQLELVIAKFILGPLSFENEELVLFLLILNQIFSTDNSQEILTLRFHEANYLIWLPSLSWKQFYWNFSTKLKFI